MSLKAKPTRRHRHNVRLDASVTRSGGFVLETIVTDFSLDGCCLEGYFQPREIIDLAIRSIGRFPAQIQWVKVGRAGARFLSRRASAPGRSLLADARGVAAIEYAFLASLIAVTLVAAFTALGDNVGERFAAIGAAVESALAPTYDSDNQQL